MYCHIVELLLIPFLLFFSGFSVDSVGFVETCWHGDLSLSSLYGAIRNNETDGDHQNLMGEIFAENPGKKTVWTAEKISTSESFIRPVGYLQGKRFSHTPEAAAGKQRGPH